MAKTGKEIEQDIYTMLRASDLAKALDGLVYRSGYRPRDSRKEDAIVIFTAGLPDEIETGVVTINIYAPDVDPYNNGVWVEGPRTTEISRMAADWVDSPKPSDSNYIFRLREAIRTEEEPETNQHFVVIKLGYRLYEG